MIRIPHLFVPNLKLLPLGKKVDRLVIAHPRSVQYVQYDPVNHEVVIRYTSGQEMSIRDDENPKNARKMFDDLVYQIKDTSDN